MSWAEEGRGGFEVEPAHLIGVDLEVQCGVAGCFEDVVVFPEFGAWAVHAEAHQAAMPGAGGIGFGEADLVHAFDGLGGEVKASEGFGGQTHHAGEEVLQEPALRVVGGLFEEPPG